MEKPTIAEARYQDELRLSRRILKDEMGRALRAISPVEKKELVATWKATYSPDLVRELLRVAKDREARVRIANWNLGNFDKERIKK